MQAFECTGKWWVPNKEKDCAAGTLKVSESGNLRLWLVGSLGPVEMGKNKGYPVILGWVDKSPFGDIVTLSGCVVGGSTLGSAFGTRENYLASRAYFGAHLKQEEDFAFTSMSLHLGGLSEWAHNYSGFGNDHYPSDNPDDPTRILDYVYKNPLVARVQNDQVRLGINMISRHNIRERSYQESVSFNISCETAKSPDQLNIEYVYPLQSLMTFVCDRPQDVQEFSVRPGEFPLNMAGHEIRVIMPRVQPEIEEETPEPVRSFQMLFTLADLVDFGDFLQKWLSATTIYIEACNVYFGLQYGPPAYLDIAFPSVVQCLYLYYSCRADSIASQSEDDRRLKKILSALSSADAEWVVDRLGGQPLPPLQLVVRKLVEEHSDTMNPLISNRQDRFINEVINTMKFCVLRQFDMTFAARHGAGLYWMMQKLRILFKSCMLRELGFSAGKATKLFQRNPLYQHMCRIELAEETARQQSQK